MKRVICWMTFLALSVPVSQVCAQEIGDTQNGLALAQQVCSECHAIRRGQARSPNTRARRSRNLQPLPE
jgi:mono/diheme cytochrome c family protein